MKKGLEKAPHRSLLYALGLTKEEIDRPIIGVVNSASEVVPGHMHLDKIAEAVKAGIRMAGGTPLEFPAIAVCDGIAMNHEGMRFSLPSRDYIADSCEIMARAHSFDGLVFIPNCDKTVPGMLMAMMRLNLPSILVSGGPMLPGYAADGKHADLISVFEAVGGYKAGRLSAEELQQMEERACPGCGSCAGMFTANSMNCLAETIGVALPGNGTIPAVYSARLRLAKYSGMRVMELLRQNIRPLDIVTRKSVENAITVDMALGCSTNTVLHLPAIFGEANLDINLDIFDAVSRKTPNLCHLSPAGKHYMIDLDNAGGIRAVMNELARGGLIHTDCLTVTGKTVGENIKDAKILNTDVIHTLENPYSKDGGISILRGNIAPKGAVVNENTNGIITVNGHSYEDPALQTGNTNFALLVAKHFSEPFKDSNGYGESIARLSNMLGGGVIIQRFGDLIRGQRSTPKRIEESFVTPTLSATPGDLSLVMPKRILDGIIEMIYALDKIAPGTANDDTLLYGVEVKFYNMEVQLDNNLQTCHPGLFVIGDGSGVTHSLSHASASGVYVARYIAENA